MQLKIRQTTDKKKEINFHSRIFDFPCSSRKEVILRPAQKGVREIRQLKPYLSAQTCILRVWIPQKNSSILTSSLSSFKQ